MNVNILKQAVLALGLCVPLFAQAELGAYLKAGTLGVGGGVGYGINDMLTARVGYTVLNLSRDLSTDDVDYKGDVKLGGGEALLDWHPFEGTFRVTGGAIFSRNKIDVDAKLNHSPIFINGTPYDVNDIGSIDGAVKFNSTVPYLGIGWGNIAGKNGHFHFIVDMGVEFMGSPKVELSGGCAATFAASNPAECAQLQDDIKAEEDELNDDVSNYKWWPVINVGVAYRF
jgi:hypothetical protein